MTVAEKNCSPLQERTMPFDFPLKGLLVFISLLCVAIFIILTSITVGSYPVSAFEALWTVAGKAPSEMAETVVVQFRLPRALAAALAGAMFAGSGAILQSISRNSLADPSLVGVSQGASFTVVAMTILLPQLSHELRPLFAIFGSLLVAFIIQLISKKSIGTSTMRFILTGVGIAAFFSAVTGAMLTYGNIDRAMSAMVWLAGSISSADWTNVWFLGVFMLILLPLLCWASRPLKALRMGAEIAISLGCSYNKAQSLLIILAVILAAVAVSAVGPIGFIGLIAPHFARLLAKTDPGLHLFISMMLGAVLLATADLIGRSAFDSVQIPAGLVTAIIGAPVFAFLLIRK